jgi:hypothetical protein
MPPQRKRIRAPSGQTVELGEKGVSAKDPFQGSQFLKAYSSYLGQWDPEAISISTMLKMLHHPAIALAEHVIWAPLVHADWDIECPEEGKRKFIRAVIDLPGLRRLHQAVGRARPVRRGGEPAVAGEPDRDRSPARRAR